MRRNLEEELVEILEVSDDLANQFFNIDNSKEQNYVQLELMKMAIETKRNFLLEDFVKSFQSAHVISSNYPSALEKIAMILESKPFCNER